MPIHEFARLSFAARFPPDTSGDPCNVQASEFELVDANGATVAGTTVEIALAASTPWRRRCESFTVEFQESAAGVDFGIVRVRGSDADISKVPGAKGGGRPERVR